MSAAKRSGATAAKTHPEKEESKQEREALKFGNPFKYAEKHKRAEEAKLDYDPMWSKRDYIFTANVSPKGPNSVFGQLHKITAEKGPIKGSDLAKFLRHHAFPNEGKRSKYVSGSIPAVGWAEGYIDGAVSKGFLKAQAPKEEDGGSRRKSAE